MRPAKVYDCYICAKPITDGAVSIADMPFHADCYSRWCVSAESEAIEAQGPGEVTAEYELEAP